ncbi:adenine deaminase [Fonticella tunisiensis]|uniref:Adenine deaminase n=1 Tax=Fonticella tunisiensis TaxID=1096341 RepID=A0A4V3ETS4_9CLOT|nr:adenine deaminase [Fonticella tunisiensis]TDT63675.1 adenine deaminase [Fonticella tunisiensis]
MKIAFNKTDDITIKDRLRKKIAVAGRNELADIVIRNGKIVDVFNGEIIHSDVALVDGVIAGIGHYDGKKIIDAEGRYVCPSFIDGHVHIESSMVTPKEFAKVLLLHGVTAAVADPHEIANVCGIDGIKYMLNESRDLPFDFYFMLPSCVPSVPFEHSGEELNKDDLEPFLNHPNVLGLAEVMDYPAVLNGEESITDKIMAARKANAKIDGHGAGLNCYGINVYRTAGISTDHECVSVNEAKERIQRGMYVMIREGTAAKNLDGLIDVVTPYNSRRCIFVTDDKHVDELVRDGSVDNNIRLAIKKGLPPITAIQMASLNTAECFGLHTKGAVAPGYDADLLLLDDLKTVKVHSVFKNGRIIVENGILKENCFKSNEISLSSGVKDTLHLPKLSLRDFRIPLKGKSAHVIGIIPNSILTEHLIEDVEAENGFFKASVERDQLKIAVIERHKLRGCIGLGIVKGFKIKCGAIASTVAHDSHNLIIVGTNDSDMIFAAQELEKLHGGITVVRNGEVLASLPLPVAGLISEFGFDEVVHQLEKLNEAVHSIGASSFFNPFLTLSFLALPVVPELKITDDGLFDVKAFKHIEVSAG